MIQILYMTLDLILFYQKNVNNINAANLDGKSHAHKFHLENHVIILAYFV